MRITREQLLRAVPDTNKSRIDDFVRDFNEYADGFGISTPMRAAHFLAQCWHESGMLSHVEENLNYSADGLLKTFPKYFNAKTAPQYARKPQKIACRVYANRMGNGSEASGDGWRYRGRGFIQLTGKTNYALYQKSGFCVGDLLSHPEWLTKSPGMTKSAMWFWYSRGLNALADLDDGGKIGEDIVRRLTKKVNGGDNGLAQRLYYYRRFKKEFGL